jgi:hypothetical protein
VSDDLDPNEEVKQGEEVQDFEKAQFIIEIIK